MDATVAYALFPTADTRPREHRTLGGLVREIHAARRDATIQCVDDHLTLTDDRRLNVVSVYRLVDGSRAGLIGHAYVDGRGRQALERALAAARPDRGADRTAPTPASTPCLAAH